jgi:hypothetical protein
MQQSLKKVLLLLKPLQQLPKLNQLLLGQMFVFLMMSSKPFLQQTL